MLLDKRGAVQTEITWLRHVISIFSY